MQRIMEVALEKCRRLKILVFVGPFLYPVTVTGIQDNPNVNNVNASQILPYLPAAFDHLDHSTQAAAITYT